MSNSAVGDDYSLLKTLAHERVKNFNLYDGADRLQFAYAARADAAPGDPALLTEYIYDGGVSTVIIGRKETNAMWDPDSDGWDSLFTT